MTTAYNFYTRAQKGELFQEQLHKDPFWMLVACIMVNQTAWTQSEPVFAHMLKSSKGDPRWFLRVDPEYLEEILTPLGMVTKRQQYLTDLPVKWFQIEPETRMDVYDLPGCGTYAADSWAIFVEKDFTVKTGDKDLKRYLEKVNTPDAEDPPFEVDTVQAA